MAVANRFCFELLHFSLYAQYDVLAGVGHCFGVKKLSCQADKIEVGSAILLASEAVCFAHKSLEGVGKVGKDVGGICFVVDSQQESAAVKRIKVV